MPSSWWKVERHLHEGKTPYRAAIERRASSSVDHRDDDHAGRRLPRPSASRRPDGALFREFAFTLAGAVIVSGVRRADAVADDGLTTAPRR